MTEFTHHSVLWLARFYLDTIVTSIRINPDTSIFFTADSPHNIGWLGGAGAPFVR